MKKGEKKQKQKKSVKNSINRSLTAMMVIVNTTDCSLIREGDAFFRRGRHYFDAPILFKAINSQFVFMLSRLK